jgi:hypothetical protein
MTINAISAGADGYFLDSLTGFRPFGQRYGQDTIPK